MSTPSAPAAKPRVVFFQNGTYADMMAGGDMHFLNQVKAVSDAGHAVLVFGGHAIASMLQRYGLDVEMVLTDRRVLPSPKVETFGEQLRLFFHYAGQVLRSLILRGKTEPADIAWAGSDGWHDAIPACFSRCARKAMHLGMDAPSLAQIVRKTRPDVTGSGLASIHYWLGQKISLTLLRLCRNKRVMYVHPNQMPRLRRLGFRDEEAVFVSNGMAMELARSVQGQPKEYDVMWIGRVHPQKGIGDLFHTLSHLAAQIPGFRAVIAGKVESGLRPEVERLGLAPHVHFAGFIEEAEKFRLFKASRVFLMPSHYESWGIVIAEALACGTLVVAYELDAYRPIFGSLPRYVAPFDVDAFARTAEEAVHDARQGAGLPDQAALAAFEKEGSWNAVQRRIARMLSAWG